jgi:hypothetical protein
MNTQIEMETDLNLTRATPGKGLVWTGRVMSVLMVLFMLMDGVMKLVKPKPVVDATLQLGFPEHSIVALGVVLLFCTVLYAIPRTAILGAIFLTGYLGGAVAAKFRMDAPLFSQTLFPVYFAIIMWVGLYLRNPKLRELVPLTRD